MKIILGIDPGTVVTGWAVIQEVEGKLEPLDFGCVRPTRNMLLSDRYLTIFEAVQSIIKKYTPDVMAIETPFVDKNIQSALKLAMARGIIIVAAKQSGLSIFEYAPTKIKSSVTGRGQANKFQVQSMVKQILELEKLPEPEDAADALACAICHAHAARFTQLLTGAL